MLFFFRSVYLQQAEIFLHLWLPDPVGKAGSFFTPYALDDRYQQHGHDLTSLQMLTIVDFCLPFLDSIWLASGNLQATKRPLTLGSTSIGIGLCIPLLIILIDWMRPVRPKPAAHALDLDAR